MIANPAKTPIISFNNNTPLFQRTGGIQPRETSSERLELRILVKSDHILHNSGEYHFPGTWRIEVRRHNLRKIMCPTKHPRENSMQTIGKLIDNEIC